MAWTGLLFARSGSKRTLVLMGVALCLSAILQASSVGERARALADRIIAPCCWREAVSVHQSPVAADMLQQIHRDIAGGQSEEAVLERLIREHGRRLLREPEGTQRNWLYWIPVAVVAAGLALVIRLLRGWTASRAMRVDSGSVAVLPDVDMFLQED